MKFYFKEKGGDLHLYQEDGIIDKDLGKLEASFTGKLKTHNIFSANYVLQDISGMFSKGKKYSIKSNKGLDGIIEKCSFSKYYELK